MWRLSWIIQVTLVELEGFHKMKESGGSASENETCEILAVAAAAASTVSALWMLLRLIGQGFRARDSQRIARCSGLCYLCLGKPRAGPWEEPAPRVPGFQASPVA